MRSLYKVLGLIFVGLGILGIPLPVLPTTPFLLLALWFFARSSPRLKHWLLTNRLCGKYISDFHNGNGIPARVKAYILILMWATITVSALCFVPLVPVKVLLFVIAAGVSIHILRMKTKRTYDNILIFVPTESEAVFFSEITGAKPMPREELWVKYDKGGLRYVVTGVGMAETAAAAAALPFKRPELAILAGFAGAYRIGGRSIGDCVAVERERVADLGAVRDGSFKPLYQREYAAPFAERITSLPKAIGCTVSCGGSGMMSPEGFDSDSGTMLAGQLENMEGAAFYSVCTALESRYIEVRAISNYTDSPRAEWKTEEAALALAHGIKKLVDEIKA